MPEMRIENLKAGYGDMEILSDINLTLKEGKMTCLLGPNGAGKSTLLETMMNLPDTNVKEGHIFVGENEITGEAPGTISREHGVRMVKEEEAIFGMLSVENNLEVALDGLREDIDKDERERKKEMIYNLFPRLEERKSQEGSTLSGGERKMVAIALGIIAEPDILLIDEISQGVMPILVGEIYNSLREIHSEETVLIVDQEPYHPLSISDYVYILEEGKIVLEGPPEDIKEEEHVIEAYLGVV